MRYALLGLVLAAGCGPATVAGPTTVRGSVTFQGRPLAGGLVVFAPNVERGRSGKPLAATVGDDGHFALSLDGVSQVPAGWYRVALAEPAGAGGFPAALRRPDLAGLDREVVAGRENVFHFAVEVGQ